MNIHTLYNYYLDRCAEYEILKKPYNVNDCEINISRSREARIVKWRSDYIRCERTCSYLDFIYQEYILNLYYNPSINKLTLYDTYLKEVGLSDAKALVKLDIINSSDYKYLENCRKHFYGVSKCRIVQNKIMKFYGPVGTSGYANICNDICNELEDMIDFVPLTFQNYNFSCPEDYILQSKLSINNNISSPTKYKYIVIHSTPDLWPAICNYERSINSNVIIYGITVWETEEINKSWTDCIQYVDCISTPSAFSAISFSKYHDQVDVVLHPVRSIKNTKCVDMCPLKNIRNDYDYIFYNISEWTNRKGICELVDIYLKTFSGSKNVLLYIKTFGDISEIEGSDYIKNSRITHNVGDYPKIILDYKMVSESYIHCIHNCSDCYVSPTKGEGQGIGACVSVQYHNHVIITEYGGQIEYLGESAEYIPYELEPATFCCTWSKKHRSCKLLPSCKYFPSFIPSYHSWANVNQKLFGEAMTKAYNCHKINHIPLKPINFRENFLYSIRHTRKKKVEFLQKQVLLLRPQEDILNFSENKPIDIILLNSAGYGNVGDDAYKTIICNYFNDDKRNNKYNIIHVPDAKIMTSSGDLINYKLWDPIMGIYHFDYLIIGGGGLINKERSSSNHPLQIYSKYSTDNNIPYYLISIGCQDLEVSQNEFNWNIYKFKDLLCNSSYISTRSPNDYSVFKSIMNDDVIDKRISNACENTLQYHPDLVYSYPIINNYHKAKNILLMVYTPYISLNIESVRDTIHKILQEEKLQLVMMNWGSEENIDNEEELFTKYFKNRYYDSLFYRGKGHGSNYFNMDILQNILSNTKKIIPGRYHSLVFSRLYNIEVIDLHYKNYKFDVDNGQHIFSSSLIPLHTIKNMIDNEENNSWKFWNDQQRNSNIVKIHNKSCISIKLIQNWSNYTIYKELLKMF